MKAVVALVCLGLALASRPPSDIHEYKPKDIHQETSYVPGKMYRYYYDSQLLHGINKASTQRSGQRIQAVAEVYVEGANKMVLQLRSVRMGSLNERLHQDAESRILRTDAFEEAEINEDFKRHLESPVLFKREHGLISALEYAQEEPEWTLNIKRSIMSLMSHNLEAHAVVTPKELYCPRAGECAKPAQQNTEDLKYYQAYETTVEGNCETSYSLVQNPEGRESAVWNVTKSINLGKCQNPHGSMYGRPEIRYNFHLSDSCPQCDYKGKMLNSTTMLTVNVIGERADYVIERVQAVSDYDIPDLSDDQHITYRAKVNQSLILMAVEQKQAPQPATKGSQLGHSLMYSLNWDALKEKFFMEGATDFHDASPYSKKHVKDIVDMAVKQLKQLARDMKASIPDVAPELRAPQTFLRVVRIMRMMTESDFEKLHEQAYSGDLSALAEQDKKAIRDLIHTCMGASGTISALKHINKCITENKINQREAVQALRQFQNARVVGREAVELMQQLYQQIDIDQPALRQTAILTYGSMARTFCMPRENKLAVELPLNTQARSARSRAFCAKEDRQKIVQNLIQYFNENQESWTNRLAALKALANAGLPEAVPELRKIIYNKELAEPMRVEAVTALRNLKDIIPQQVIAVLMPIIQDREMEPAVRMASVYVFMRCKPSLVQMTQLASQVNEKKDSRQVKSFIYTSLSNLANNTINPCQARQAENARQVLHLIRNDEKVIAGSFMSRTERFNKERQSNYGAIYEVFSSMSNHSYLPAVAGWNMGLNGLGFENQEVLTLLFGQEGIDRSIVKYLSQYLEEPQSRARRSLTDEIKKQLADLTANFESFNVEQAHAYAAMVVLGQDTAFLPMDKSTFQTVKNYMTMDKIRSLTEKINVNLATMFSETMYKIPSAMGLPLVVRVQNPILAQLKGSIGKINKDGYWVKDVKLTPSVVSKSELSCEVWSPIVNSGIKVNVQLRAQLPVKGSLKKTGEIEIQLPSTSGKELLKVVAEPLCFVRKWYQAEPNTYVKSEAVPIMSSQHDRFQRYVKRSGSWMGMEFDLRGLAHKNTIEGSRDFPMSLPVGTNVIRVIARQASSQSCDTLRLKLHKPSFQWSSSQESLKIEDFEVSESRSSEEASTESQSWTASAQSPFYVTKMNVEAECGDKKTLELKYIESADSRLRKVSADLKQNGNKKYCAQGQVYYPKTPMTPEQATGKTYSQFVYAWNGDCEGSQATPVKRVQINMQSEKSKAKAELEREYQQQHKQCLTEESPVACYDIVKRAAQPNKHSLKIKYDSNMPLMYKNATQKAFLYFLSGHRQHADVNKYVKSEANEIKATIRVDPRTTSRVNVTVSEPGQTIKLQDINSCLFNWETAMLSKVLKPSTYNAYCTVADSHIESFDQVWFSAPVTNCWSVLAKDCSPRNRFAVLMKRNTMGSPQKTLAIVTKSQKIEISNSFQVQVNGQQKSLTEPITKLSDDLLIQQYGGQKIKVSLPKQRVVVYFDGQAAKVAVNPLYFTEQCGLCGHYNRDARDVFRSPLAKQQDSIVEFFKQYQIEIEGCQKEPQKPQDYNFGSNYHTARQNRRQPREVSPINRIVGMHIDGEYCISKEKKAVCPLGYHPSQYEKERVNLHCISDEVEAREIARRVHQQANEFQLPTEFDETTTQSFRIPSKCKRV